MTVTSFNARTGVVTLASSDVSAVLSSASSTTAGSSAARAESDRYADNYLSPIDFGAKWNGSSNPVSSVLGTGYNSISALAGYVAPNGTTPYAWIATYPATFGFQFTMTVGANQTSGQPVLAMTPYGTSYYPFGQVCFSGMTVTGSSFLPAGCTVASVVSYPDPLVNITLSGNLTGIIPAGTVLTFAMTSVQIQSIEMDWLGTQSAVNYAMSSNANLGNNVQFPVGVGVFGNGTFAGLEIIIPIATYTQIQSIIPTGFLITGKGSAVVSELSFPFSLGGGRSALRKDFSWITGTNMRLENFALIGSGNPTNAAPSLTSSDGTTGILVSTGFRLEYVKASGFRNGFQIVGDHQYMFDYDVTASSLFGVYFGYQSGNDGGDQVFHRGNHSACGLGCFGFAFNNGMSYSDLYGLKSSGSPYAFVGEDPRNSANAAIASGLMGQVKIENCSFESIGNGAFIDFTHVNYNVNNRAVNQVTFANNTNFTTGQATSGTILVTNTFQGYTAGTTLTVTSGTVTIGALSVLNGTANIGVSGTAVTVASGTAPIYTLSGSAITIGSAGSPVTFVQVPRYALIDVGQFTNNTEINCFTLWGTADYSNMVFGIIRAPGYLGNNKYFDGYLITTATAGCPYAVSGGGPDYFWNSNGWGQTGGWNNGAAAVAGALITNTGTFGIISPLSSGNVCIGVLAAPVPGGPDFYGYNAVVAYYIGGTSVSTKQNPTVPVANASGAFVDPTNPSEVAAQGTTQSQYIGQAVGTGTTSVNLCLQIGPFVAQIAAYNYVVPTTGQTIAFPQDVQALTLFPAGGLATLTVTLPATNTSPGTPVDGTIISISTTRTLTSLTVNANSGQSISGGYNGISLSAGKSLRLQLVGTGPATPTWVAA